MSLPPAVPTPVIYLMCGILPAVAERDLQIMRLVSQLSMCSQDIQTVLDIVENHRVKNNIQFPVWSGVAWRMAAIYSLEDQRKDLPPMPIVKSIGYPCSVC